MNVIDSVTGKILLRNLHFRNIKSRQNSFQKLFSESKAVRLLSRPYAKIKKLRQNSL
jgi:hypothetical protein